MVKWTFNVIVFPVTFILVLMNILSEIYAICKTAKDEQDAEAKVKWYLNAINK